VAETSLAVVKTHFWLRPPTVCTLMPPLWFW